MAKKQAQIIEFSHEFNLSDLGKANERLRIYGIYFRTALATLSKSSAELEEMIIKDADDKNEAIKITLDFLKKGQKMSELSVDVFKNAQARMVFAARNAVRRIDMEEGKKARQAKRPMTKRIKEAA